MALDNNMNIICYISKKYQSHPFPLFLSPLIQSSTNALSILPLFFLFFLFLQEVGNVPYVVENGCGKFSKSPKEIAKIVADWFGPKADELKAMSQNALKLARPDAVFKIVNDLHELVRQRSLIPQFSCTT